MQIEPGPIPTLTASAPALARKRAASAVAILPTIICSLGNSFLIDFKTPITFFECPCAVSMVITSTPASTKARARSSESFVIPIAAPTRKRPQLSLQAFGLDLTFKISL